ncbi:SpoIIE family protein phosphatase [Aequorivita viscosa]|uniref:Sigma-B regulation protein RsbU (Phosphoserine phosphatase) n=1 Tax=Aequorivita viscosa TaxID=797419 RepID=A0A1M6N362_9FLAO|nr:SpoIIE family protein phosphatase [Aequorivita viscosa]SDX41317.1 sigma-B regulation protein RsbU (phosphoserine phosphatase) [Aequorivita viscosa]SHJ90160.1 sigma-B regulation protein RsbU (phosphoserine phosphatase) [Aequorivita viscosa]
MSLRSKLILFISIGVIAIYLALFGWIQNYYKDQLIKEGIFEMVLTGKFLKSEIQNKTIKVEETVQNVAHTIEGLSPTDIEILSILKQTIIYNPGETYGMTMAYLPEIKRHSPYFYMKNDSIYYKDLAEIDGYNYEETDWFKGAITNKQRGWTNDPYTDVGGGEDKMITYHDYIHNPEGDLMAVLTGDLTLSFISEILTSEFVTKFPYNKWISRGNVLILSETNSSQNTISFDEKILNAAKEVSHINLESAMSLHETKWKGENIYLLSLPLDFSNWDLQIAFKKADILHSYQKTIRVLQLFFSLGLLILIIVTAWITNRAIKPIMHLSESISKMGDGKLDYKVPYSNRKDEVGVLATAFENMQINLKKYINDLKISTSKQARIHNELEVGHDIQKALLPSPEELKHITAVSIGSYMKPATEVGGDIYDYFELPDGNICFVVGDVSGKGIPASLLMASVRSSIRALATNGKSPSEILTYVNNDLAEKNKTFHFITLICGVTDFANQQFAFCNAGHERPFLLQEGKTPEEIVTTPQTALGISPNFKYKNQLLSFEKNTTLFLYSDGVTDALNEVEVSFGKTQLIQVLSRQNNAETVVSDCVAALENHTLQAEAFDDITILAIQFKT